MPKRSIAQTAQSREDLVVSASALMRSHGFDGVGIDAIAERAGLTAGAFYRHFDSKQALLVEVVQRAIAQAAAHMPTLGDADDVTAFVAAYLAQRKFKTLLAGCVVAAMSPDLLRNGDTVRNSAGQYLKQIHAAMSLALQPRHAQRASDLAWHIMSAATGGLILARLLGGETAAQIDTAVMAATATAVKADRAVKDVKTVKA
jgi:TetR/AcrR family transcriptional regulator, transcriptional repressor for nem operon